MCIYTLHISYVLCVIPEEEGRDLSCLAASLIQVMLDPYFRTIVGFQSLIQKEWVMAGYQFLDRCNHLKRSDKEVNINCICMWWQYLVTISLNCLFTQKSGSKNACKCFKISWNWHQRKWAFGQDRDAFSLSSVALWEPGRHQVQSDVAGFSHCFSVPQEKDLLLQTLAQPTLQVEINGC